jgi:hypothetical protein
MRRLSALVLAGFLLAGTGLGCHGEQNKGINSGKDKPLPKKDEGRSTNVERMTKPQ